MGTALGLGSQAELELHGSQWGRAVADVTIKCTMKCAQPYRDETRRQPIGSRLLTPAEFDAMVRARVVGTEGRCQRKGSR